MADSIIQQGTTEDGNYIKFRDGTLLMWGFVATASTAYGTINFPVPVVSMATTFVYAVPRYAGGSNALDYLTVAQYSTTTRAYVYFYRSDSSGTTKTSNASASWLVIGRWK